MDPLYTTTGISTGDGRNGTAALADGTLEFALASPRETGGKGGGANPEQLFALGYAACFHSALKVVGGRLKKPVAGSTVTAEVALGRDDGGYGLAVKLTASLPELTAAECASWRFHCVNLWNRYPIHETWTRAWKRSFT